MIVADRNADGKISIDDKIRPDEMQTDDMKMSINDADLKE